MVIFYRLPTQLWSQKQGFAKKILQTSLQEQG